MKTQLTPEDEEALRQQLKAREANLPDVIKEQFKEHERRRHLREMFHPVLPAEYTKLVNLGEESNEGQGQFTAQATKDSVYFNPTPQDLIDQKRTDALALEELRRRLQPYAMIPHPAYEAVKDAFLSLHLAVAEITLEADIEQKFIDSLRNAKK